MGQCKVEGRGNEARRTGALVFARLATVLTLSSQHYTTTAATGNVGIMPLRAGTSSTDDTCIDVMRHYCNGLASQKCLSCASTHATELKAAGCTNAAVEDICNDDQLKQVRLQVVPPKLPYPVSPTKGSFRNTFFVAHASNGTSCEADICDSKQVLSGNNLVLDSSTNPFNRYALMFSGAGYHVDGSLVQVTSALALRVAVETGPIDTTITLHWTYLVSFTDSCVNPSNSTCSLTGGNFSNAIDVNLPTQQTVVGPNSTHYLGGWKVTCPGSCSDPAPSVTLGA
jgi:hypothetical protein